MPISFLHSFKSEWLKKRHSLASWIVVVGAFFTPVIIIIARLVRSAKQATIYSSPDFWFQLWRNSWESMAIFLIPLGIILATSLIVQIEYKNNAWKQLYTTPQSLVTIFFAKLAVILVMLAQFFVLFNIGIYLSAVVPYLLIRAVPYPATPIPVQYFLWENLHYFVDVLPIIALQYLISLRYKNFMVSIGAGFIFWIGALSALSWKFGYVIPYTYGMYNYVRDSPGGRVVLPAVDIHGLAIGYFVIFTAMGLVLYLTKTEKG